MIYVFIGLVAIMGMALAFIVGKSKRPPSN